MKDKDLKLIHDMTYNNKEDLKNSECFCLYCLKTFNYNDIYDFVVNEAEETALCPFCSIDAVINLDKIKSMNYTLEDLKHVSYVYFNEE